MPSSRESRHADVIVIGAGILGTFHAYFAARKGYKTLLIERNSFPNEASTRNFGMVTRSIVGVEGEWAAFARQSAELYRSIQHEQDISVRNTGSLYLASTEAERRVLEEFAQLYGADYHCSYFDASEALYRYPFIQASYCTGALLFADDLTIEPRRLLRQFIPFVTATSSVEYLPNTTVLAIESAGQVATVKDARGNLYSAERVYLCSGAEHRILFPELFLRSGLRVCKLQMMQTVAQPPLMLPHAIASGLSIERYPVFESCSSYPLLAQQSVDDEIRKYDIHLLFKQAIDGTIIIGDSHEYSSFQDVGMRLESTNQDINEAILRYGKQMVTLPTWDIDMMWNGYYLTHPQAQVYTETINGHIHVAIGIAGKGMSTGPGFSFNHVETTLH